VCYDEGILQSYIDGNSDNAVEIARHLEQCGHCRRTLDTLRANDLFVRQCLSVFPSDLPATGPAAGTSLSVVPETIRIRMQKRLERKLNFMPHYKKVVAAAVMAAVLFTAFSFPAVRSIAGEFLTIFRVESLQTIDISQADIQELERIFREGAGNVDIENFGKIEVSGKPESVPVNPAEAAAAVDFDLKLPVPDGYGDPELHKITGHTAVLTLATDSINAMLQTLGGTRLLPAELNGESFSIHIPTGIIATYDNGSGETLFVAQSRSPEINTSANVDIREITDSLLSIPALPENLRRQLRAVNDLQHTLLIPNVDGRSREVYVNGTTGVLITSENGDAPDTVSLVWQQNSIIYIVAGTGLDVDYVLAIAAGMK
jgi:hypothetical protein